MKRIAFISICLLCQLIALAQWNTDQILFNGKKALYIDNEYVLSIQYFNQIISLKPYLAEPFMYRSVAKINLGDFMGAEDDCNKSIEINPFVPYAFYIRGFVRANLNKFEDAIQDLDKALEFQPNDTSFISFRLGIREELKDYKGAVSDVDLLLKLQPNKHKLLYYKANYLLQLKDTTNAVALFKKHNELNSRSYLGWSALGLINMLQHNDKEALENYNKAVSLKSTFPGDYINRGNLNKSTNNFKQALADYDTAVKLDSTEVLGRYNRAMLLLYLGDDNRALADLTKTVELDSTNYEARWRKAILELTLVHNYRNAMADYKIILQKYPYFIPAISGLAEAEEATGNLQKAYIHRQQVKTIEKNKEYYKQKSKQTIAASNTISTKTQNIGRGVKKRNSIFSEYDENAVDTAEFIVGKIQDRKVNVVNEKNFTINTFVVNKLPRRTNLSQLEIDQINKLKITPLKLVVSNNDIPLMADVISIHFQNIKTITDSIDNKKNRIERLFYRAIEFSLVKDYTGAINDLNKVIDLSPNYFLAYFCRASIRQKLYENQRATATNPTTLAASPLALNGGLKQKNADAVEIKDDVYNVNAEMIIRDYNKTTELNPNFSFAYYNKANFLCIQKDFKTAIINFTKSIEADPDFAEAYFNRGLTYLFIGEDTKGLTDLSKSGELGIYKAYNLIQRFKKN